MRYRKGYFKAVLVQHLSKERYFMFGTQQCSAETVYEVLDKHGRHLKPAFWGDPKVKGNKK